MAAISVIFQLPKDICCPLPLPLSLLKSSFFCCVFFVCFVLVLLYNCHPRTDLHCSPVFNSLSPLPFVLSLFLCVAEAFLIAFKKGCTGYNF